MNAIISGFRIASCKGMFELNELKWCIMVDMLLHLFCDGFPHFEDIHLIVEIVGN
jgi:hypothetical protein